MKLLEEQDFKELKEQYTVISKLLDGAVNLPNSDDWKFGWNIGDAISQSPIGRAIESKEKILKVTKRIRSNYTFTGPRVTLIHLEKIDASYPMIKINYPIKEYQHIMPSVISIIHNEKRDIYFVRMHPELFSEIAKLCSMAIEENLAEFYNGKPTIEENENRIPEIKYWNKIWLETPHVPFFYDSINDPNVINIIKNNIFPLKSKLINGESLKLLDLGAGNGRLAEKIIKLAQEEQIPLCYILVEPSEGQIVEARIRLDKLQNSNCEINYVNSTIEDYDLKTQTHGIISSGGPFNLNITTRAKSIVNLQKAKDLLKPEGILVITGLTSLTIKSKHFQKVGLDVISYCTHDGLSNENQYAKELQPLSFFGQVQRYVCKHKLEKPKEESLFELKLS